MFDRHTHVHGRERTNYVTRTVNEHRAPTDDSVKLLREMEKASADEVLKKYRLDCCGMDCMVEVYQDAASDQFVARAVVNVNGHQIKSEYGMTTRLADPVGMMEGLTVDLGEKIAAVMLREQFAALATPFSSHLRHG